MKDEIYRRIIVLLALKVNFDSELFQGTLRVAIGSIMAQHGVQPDAAFTLADPLNPLITAELTAEREMLRLAIPLEHTGCNKPECAACRVVNWAKTATPTPGAVDAALEKKIQEALRQIDRKGPAN